MAPHVKTITPTTKKTLLKQVLIVTLILSFTVLIAGGLWIFKTMAPQPGTIQTTNGQVVSTIKEIKGGQAVWQKYGLMDYGSVLGQGSYLGPDYTAEALHILTQSMQNYYAKNDFGKSSFNELTEEQKITVRERVIEEIKENRYNEETDALVITDAQFYGLQEIRKYYADIFTNGNGNGILPGLINEGDIPETDRAWVAEGDQLKQISDFFFWTAWLSAAKRPNDTITYTNNWPYDLDAGNTMPYSAIWWSAASTALLILLTAVILYFHYRYHFGMQEAYEPDKFPKINLQKLPLTPSQVKSGKYFTIVALLFLIQAGLGGLLAHYYIDPDSFYGLDWIVNLLPFNIAKTYHLQLAIFWIATAWLGMGVYVAPIIGGKEPKKQGLLVNILFWALIVLVGGSVIGEWLGAKGYLGNLWFLLGHQGWEYLELGRLWQVVLAVGMLIWLFIVFRGMRSGLRAETDKGGLIHLLFYASIAVPAFYVFAFFYNPGSNFTYSDYWRWWIIHLWVEGIFEVFAVVVIGFLMVHLGLVTRKSTLRALYFQLTILMGSGVIGIGHHYYYNGSAEIWIGLGAVFSALEVIPLTLLILEAYDQYKMMKAGGVDFPYRSTFWFLISTAIWNLVGAGVLGFLINLPAVNYYEHGSYLTPAHGHGSMMGVYGMFAIAVLLFCLRNIVKPETWNDKLLKISCWGLNIGLAGMIIVTLLPVGMIQMQTAFESGFWAARAADFYNIPIVNKLLWIRVIPDTIFILFGVVPLAYFAVKSLFHLRKPNRKEGENL
ncbi:nitric-oxide reductase large subunit [Microaerobacter geothermalis]|uniref:nitric-oxide reductase large subunit n=1 Tax=Microaerobacter geothermalis TaxID=674972 RepID=UPI001F1D207A|nr:nitric-oxide reductase large subunit [Microaerobacter geothermalis]MCF6092440.1 nitric-oxide reductase large subunit [Microaerobacter geothermalis]